MEIIDEELDRFRSIVEIIKLNVLPIGISDVHKREGHLPMLFMFWEKEDGELKCQKGKLPGELLNSQSTKTLLSEMINRICTKANVDIIAVMVDTNTWILDKKDVPKDKSHVMDIEKQKALSRKYDAISVFVSYGGKNCVISQPYRLDADKIHLEDIRVMETVDQRASDGGIFLYNRSPDVNANEVN